MALETLKNLKRINGSMIIRIDEIQKDKTFFKNGKFDWVLYDSYRDQFHISISDSKNIISFKIQDGPIKDNGINGCQVDALIDTSLLMIQKLNKKLPCEENAVVMSHLNQALIWLRKRKMEREMRGVEGTNEK